MGRCILEINTMGLLAYFYYFNVWLAAQIVFVKLIDLINKLI